VNKLAQLIKLRDYVSRYETNPFHYPTQFIRLKQENWRKLMLAWEKENVEQLQAKRWQAEAEKERVTRFHWNPFKQYKDRAEDPISYKRTLPESKDQLRKFFLNRLYPFQLKWATSTLTQISYTERDHYFDQDLKFYLQHFPDIYFVMYYPIFNIKNAPVDVEVILISPVEIEIVTRMDAKQEETIRVDDERTWTVGTDKTEQKIISPTLGLKRTQHIIESILQAYGLTYNIKKTVLSKEASFLYGTEPYNVSLIGPSDYKRWYQQKRNVSGALKGAQLKVMEALLKHSLSTSVRRPEWERDKDEENTSFIIGE